MDAKILALTNSLSKLEKKTSILETFQIGGVNRTQICTNNKVRDPNKSYVEELNNIESWIVNKSKDHITRDGQDWYWCPKHNMEGKLDVM